MFSSQRHRTLNERWTASPRQNAAPPSKYWTGRWIRRASAGSPGASRTRRQLHLRPARSQSQSVRGHCGGGTGPIRPGPGRRPSRPRGVQRLEDVRSSRRLGRRAVERPAGTVGEGWARLVALSKSRGHREYRYGRRSTGQSSYRVEPLRSHPGRHRFG
jgi:hypothetical protein